eukprot:CAMPEP_0177621896 /NCGR_PEP_ID=MMETSP0419_2-20121207/27888_1 /TAXON_ID=582737 /ORGANISM="Tetraselmis sp., Strain GSL018" /LENGTH=120 /DNA_ID=CAMNT_0019121961 /DNA_START=100 /DNA_END=459 /DNA_ORIENTATION=+
MANPKFRKVLAVHDFLQNFSRSNRSVLLFADASDVIYLGGNQEIFKSYVRYLNNTITQSVIFGAEKNFWPYFSLGRGALLPDAYRRLEQYPKFGNDPYPFANAGLWIGDVSSAANLVRNW